MRLASSRARARSTLEVALRGVELGARRCRRATSRSSSASMTSSVSWTRSGRCRRRRRGHPVSSNAGPVRVHGVREAALLPHLLEQARRHAAAERLVQHRQRVAVGVVAGQRAHAEHDVRLLGRSVASPRSAPAAPMPSVDARSGRSPSSAPSRAAPTRSTIRRARGCRRPRPRCCRAGSARGGTRRSRRAPSPAMVVVGAEHRAAERVVREQRLARTGRARGRRACRRASRSLRGSPGARSRPRRAGTPAPRRRRRGCRSRARAASSGTRT